MALSKNERCFDAHHLWLGHRSHQLLQPVEPRIAARLARIPVSLLAGAGAAWALAIPRLRLPVCSLLAAFGLSSITAHPDYLSYFNLLAGSRPETIVVDSDLDWGQDMHRAWRRIDQRGIREVTLLVVMPAHFVAVPSHIQIYPFLPDQPRPGWALVSLTGLSIVKGRSGAGKPLWTDGLTPVERIGKGMLLYHIRPDHSVP